VVSLEQKLLPDAWGRNMLRRYRVEQAPSGFPSHIMVKVSNVGGGHVFGEWSCLRFLSQFDALKSLIPAFYGGERALELLVMEDLGSVRGTSDLGTILEGDDPDHARAALLAHAREMGRLHLATAGHEASFDAIRSRFPVEQQLLSKDQFRENFAWFMRLLERLELPVSRELKAELGAVVSRLAGHSPSRAFTRGDLCPSNVAYRNGRIRFFDFEMGAFRNVFLSAAYFRVSHLSCHNGSLIPPWLQAEAEAAYLDAVSPMLTGGGQDLDIASAAAAMVIWLLSLYFDKRERMRHLATRRQRMFGSLSSYLDHAPFADPLPHTAEALARLQRHMDDNWSESEKRILLFPAFRA
jgi:hypothetical protein